MCNPHSNCNVTSKPEAPEITLARLMQRELGVSVDSKALSLFLRHKWSRVTTLAHKIHESDC